jgi:energy-coupling factor transport system permease protein
MALFEPYRCRGGWIERVDPRLKLVWLALLILTVLANDTPLWLAMAPVAVIISALAAGLTFRTFYHPLLAVCLVSLQILVVQVLFCRLGYPLYHLGPLTIYSGALPLTMTAALRLTGMVLAFMQFLRWTSPADLTLLLVQARIPYRYAMLAGLGMRFLPLMERELLTIIESQAARGLPMDTAFQKLKSLLPVALPFLYRAFRRVGETALAMELRGYGRHQERTFLHEIYLSPREVLTMGFMAAVMSWQIIIKF